MDKTRIYDIKIKIEQKPVGDALYKPAYVRFLIKSNDIRRARVKALSVFTSDETEKLKFTIIKASLMKIDGMYEA